MRRLSQSGCGKSPASGGICESRPPAPQAVYRAGLERCGPDATLLFNLATVLEEREKADEAADMYRAALRESPDLPEAHYNLAMLCDAAGRKQEAIRHLSAYRKLRRH
jgi:tetratricopeptide (TPR) repeat protein